MSLRKESRSRSPPSFRSPGRLTSFASGEKKSCSSLLHGEPSAVLQALRFVFSRYPRTLERCATAAAVGGGACCASEQDAAAAASAVSVAAAGNGDAAPCCATSSSSCSSSVSLAGRALLSAACPPARFATAAVRALRHGLGIARVGLTPAQLLERVRGEERESEEIRAVFFSV